MTNTFCAAKSIYKKTNWIPVLRRGKYSPSESDYVDLFNKLLRKWRAETLWLSSITEAIDHPAFRAITHMGDKAIPLIIAELRHQPDLLLAALPIMTGEDPVQDSERGDIFAMASSWIDWYKGKR